MFISVHVMPDIPALATLQRQHTTQHPFSFCSAAPTTFPMQAMQQGFSCSVLAAAAANMSGGML
jgi:hypothetical protein